MRRQSVNSAILTGFIAFTTSGLAEAAFIAPGIEGVAEVQAMAGPAAVTNMADFADERLPFGDDSERFANDVICSETASGMTSGGPSGPNGGGFSPPAAIGTPTTPVADNATFTRRKDADIVLPISQISGVFRPPRVLFAVFSLLPRTSLFIHPGCSEWPAYYV
jgi:hypothetical protein